MTVNGAAVPRVVVVGGGIGGLAAAHRLLERTRERGVDVELVVLEAQPRVGGLVGSERFEGALLERGPDGLVPHKPAGLDLCRRLGLEPQLVGVPAGPLAIARGGTLVPVPDGFALLAPARLGPFLRSPALSLGGRLRAVAERLIPPGAGDDEAVGAFVRRRFGSEVLARLAGPIAGALYMADLERLSLAATMPRFLALEREHGSVLRGLATIAPQRGGRSPSQTVALAGGLGRLVDALVDRLPPGALRCGARVVGIDRAAAGYTLTLEDGRLAADAVILATPAPVAASLLAAVDGGLAAELGRLEVGSCATVNLAWSLPSGAAQPPLFGVFFSPAGGSPVVAATLLSVKLPQRAAAGQLVARVFLGGAAFSEQVDEAALVETAAEAVGPLLGCAGPPLWSRTYRHPCSMPQPAVGHLEWLDAVRRRTAEHRGLELAGGPLGAYGVPDAIAAGEAAAERLVVRVLAGR